MRYLLSSGHFFVQVQVYVRPAGSYVMDRLELRRVTFYPSRNSAEIVILICNFSVTTGLRVAEAALSNQQVRFLVDTKIVPTNLVFSLYFHDHSSFILRWRLILNCRQNSFLSAELWFSQW